MSYQSVPLLRAVALAVTLGTAGWAQTTARHAPPPAAVEIPVPSLWADLDRLALTGDFRGLLTQLDRLLPAATQPGVAALREDVRRYVEQAERRGKEQRELYRLTLERAGERADAGQIEEALIAAIEAHDTAPSPEALLDHAAVRGLAQRAAEAAKLAEERQDWVEAVSLYRLLHLLYEGDGRFRDDLTRASRRVRVLAMYHPALLDTLYRQRAARLGEDADALPEVERDSWAVKLAGVDREMLKEALAWTAAKHVDPPGYRPLLLGGVEAVQTLLHTAGMEDPFPMLRDAEQLGELDRFLDRVKAALEGGDAAVSDFQAESLVDNILEKNRLTLRLPERVLVYELAQGATDQVDDYTQVKWPAELEDFSRDTRGRFYGVGVQITRRDDRLVVVTPLENTPAHVAGVKAGDAILKVDGKDASTWSLEKAVREITGPDGTDVTLTLERGGDPFTVTLRRGEIKVESIRGWEHLPGGAAGSGGGWSYWIDRDAGIGYVRLSTFIPQTADDLDAAVAQMQAERPLRGLILDLRFNGGGLLASSVQVADRFIDGGDIVSTVDGEGHRTDRHRADSRRTYPDFPLVVLINRGTASASEIVTGALQDHGRAIVIGDRSFGKGSVQDVFGLANRRAALKITRQYYMLPKGRIIHRKEGATEWGVEPDLRVKMTDAQTAEALELRRQADVLRDVPGAGAGAEQETPAAAILKAGADPQLAAAMLVLQTRLVADELEDKAADRVAKLDPASLP